MFTDTPLWLEEQKLYVNLEGPKSLWFETVTAQKAQVMKDLVSLLSYEEAGARNCNPVWTMLFRIEATWDESTALNVCKMWFTPLLIHASNVCKL